MKVEGRSTATRRSYHPSSYTSSDGDSTRSVSNAGRGPRRRRPGPKQEPVQQGARKKGAKAPRGMPPGLPKATYEKMRPVQGRLVARKRRKRETKEELAALYAQFHRRIPPNATSQMMAQEFADKELRVILSQNGVLINDYDISGPPGGKYTEKTKVQKIEAILSMVKKGCLIEPARLAEVQPRQKLSRTAGSRTTYVAAVRSHTSLQHVVDQQLHADSEKVGRECGSADEEDELAPTTPATDVGAEDVTETETDVLTLLSTLASSGDSVSAGSASARPASFSSATHPPVAWDTSTRFGL